jgi:hypothetical protein
MVSPLQAAAGFSRLLKNTYCSGCSKKTRCKAPEIPKSEAYIVVRRNDEE